MSLLSISANAYRPTRKYYATVQAGLSSSSTGGGLVYVDDEATGYITVDNDKWRPNASENGSEGGNSSNTQNDMVDVYLYAMAKRGYQFEGWANSNTGTPANKGELVNGAYRSIKEFKVGNNDWGLLSREIEYTIYAVFTPKKYEITYNANGGSVSPSTPQEYTVKSTDVLRTPTRNGYTFNGWTVTAVDETDSGWTLNANAPSKLNNNIGNVTLTAQWTPTDYTISFSPDGGSGTTPTPVHYNIESTAFTLPACPYTKTGYAFVGWKPSSNVGSWSTGQTFANKASIAKGNYGNVTLVAQWKTLSSLTITVSGLESNDNVIFNVSVGSDQYTVALNASTSSITIKNLPSGTSYSVSPSSWSWVYNTPSSQTGTIGSSGSTANFTFSKKSNVKKHDEKSRVNWK